MAYVHSTVPIYMLHMCIHKLSHTGFVQGYVYPFSFLRTIMTLIMKGYRTISVVLVFEPKLSLGEGLYWSKSLESVYETSIHIR
jgi:hypothetical protein